MLYPTHMKCAIWSFCKNVKRCTTATLCIKVGNWNFVRLFTNACYMRYCTIFDSSYSNYSSNSENK